MPAYNINNSRGDLVATINVGTTTGATFPVELIGQGISLYGPIVATNQYFLLEHFASALEPTNPVEGMIWYKVNSVPHYYNGVNFIPLMGSTNTSAFGFEMLPSSQNIDFTVAGTTALFTDPNDGTSYHPTGVLLIPRSVADVATPAQFNLFINSSEDVLENVSIIAPDMNRHAFFNIEGMTAFASGASTISLEVTIPASGGGGLQLEYDVFLFGYNNP
jgi:hypothetical protein